MWIDIGSNHDDIGDAVRKLKSYTSKYPKEQVMLLYDEALDEVMIRKLRDSWDEGWTDQQVCRETMFQWKDYIGCECDAVVYVTSGDGSFVPGVRFWIFVIHFSSNEFADFNVSFHSSIMKWRHSITVSLIYDCSIFYRK